ncbi:DNA-binding protein [Calycina marina]|uniref:DNA-binding protein n=1 Tax=Calycina marina TaxID=1763456 RepID=A0A9P8CI98_9HELO|nr:DNA-binding protein [Calycina marina]
MAAPPKTILNTYQAILTTFSDFLVVAIHTILYERGLYPPETFLLTRAYNFPVRQNRHPLVCKWVNDAVTAISAQLLKGTVRRVALVVYSSKQECLERFMFDVEGFPAVPEKERLTEFEGTDGGDGEELRISRVDVEEQLRSTVRKLAYCGEKLGGLPDGCTYTVAVELKQQADPPIGHPQPWVPSEPNLQTGEKGTSEKVGADIGGVKTVPVRSVESGQFVFESWIEEGKSKQKYA